MIVGFLGLLGVVVLLSAKNGSKSAQLEALRAEIKKQAQERARAEKILNNVSNLTTDDARRRLHEIATKQ